MKTSPPTLADAVTLYVEMSVNDALLNHGPSALLKLADATLERAREDINNPSVTTAEYLSGLRDAEREAEWLREAAALTPVDESDQAKADTAPALAELLTRWGGLGGMDGFAEWLQPLDGARLQSWLEEAIACDRELSERNHRVRHKPLDEPESFPMSEWLNACELSDIGPFDYQVFDTVSWGLMPTRDQRVHICLDRHNGSYATIHTESPESTCVNTPNALRAHLNDLAKRIGGRG